MTTQAQKDALIAADNAVIAAAAEVTRLINALPVDATTTPPPVVTPPVNPPPTTGVQYLDKTHGTVLVSDGGKLGWNVAPWNADSQGRVAFMANGSTTTVIRGTKLVLQGDRVYAKQPDGSWLLGTAAGPVATTVTVTE